jgi:hypothetical protein
VVAAITNSSGKTLTRTLVSPLNLSGVNTLKFDIYAERTGSNIKVAIQDTGGTLTEITPNITTMNTWQTVTWDISGVADANKDSIYKIITTILNADA